jgi:hypothetical protein
LLISLPLLCICSGANATLNFNASNSRLLINSSENLTSDIVAGNLTIASGLTIVTNGYDIYVANAMVAQNVIFITGNGPAGGTGTNDYFGQMGTSAHYSYGGSGGAGGGWSEEWGGGWGGFTLEYGGEGYIGTGGSGSVPSPPILNNSKLQSWYSGGMQNFIEGAGGGGGGESSTDEGNGGAGAFGLYVQGQYVILTNSTIYADGGNGSMGYVNGGGGGGGGGCGRILISYHSLYLPGTYNAIGGSPGNGEAWGFNGGYGGGPCPTITYRYGSEPVSIAGPSTTTTTVPPNSGGGVPGSPPSSSCYLIQSLTTASRITVYLTGAWFNITANSITQSVSLININGAGYFLFPNETQQLPAEGNYAYYANFTGVGGGRYQLQICSTPIDPTSTTTTTSITPSSSSVSSSSTSTTISLQSTTITQSDPPVPPPGNSDFWLLLMLLLLIAIGLLAERERRKRS